MALDIKLKRSHTHSSIPSTSDLAEGEFAVNTYDGKMYMRDGSSNIVTVGSHYATDYESSTKTFYVTVASSTSAHVHHGNGSSNKYKINGVFSPYLKLIPGITYRFDQADSSNSGHPFRFYLDEDKNTSYTTGVTTSGSAGSAGAYTQIVVSHSTPSVLHYQCSAHGMMGWAAFVNTHNLTAFDTGDLSEGSNLYFTNARADARVNLQTGANLDLSSKDTGDLSEGSNLYYTDARAQAVSINNVVEDTSPQLGGDLDSNGNDIKFADNDKAIFGSGSDLIIRHDSSNNFTYIEESNANGGLVIKAKDLFLQNAAGTANTAFFQDGGEVQLRYNNSTKFQTTNTGVTVTGTLNSHTIPSGTGTIALTSDISSETFTSLAQDTSPQLGGNLDVVTHGIVSTSNRNIAITPNGSGKVVIDGLSHPVADGNAGQVLKTDGSGNLAFASVGSLAGSGIQNVSDDSSPQLGGNLDVVTHSIVSTSNRDINLTPNGSGKVVVGTNGLEFGDGSVQTAAGADKGFAIAMGIALG